MPVEKNDTWTPGIKFGNYDKKFEIVSVMLFGFDKKKKKKDDAQNPHVLLKLFHFIMILWLYTGTFYCLEWQQSHTQRPLAFWPAISHQERLRKSKEFLIKTSCLIEIDLFLILWFNKLLLVVTDCCKFVFLLLVYTRKKFWGRRR